MSVSTATETLRAGLPSRGSLLVVLLTAIVAAIEVLLFTGRIAYTLWGYMALLVALSLLPLVLEEETPLFQTFALIPVFRLVNLTMPIFIELTLFWFPLIYGPLVPVFLYLGRQTAPLGLSLDLSDGMAGTDPARDGHTDGSVPAIGPLNEAPTPVDPDLASATPAVVPATRESSDGAGRSGPVGVLRSFGAWMRDLASSLWAWLWAGRRNMLETAGIGYGLPWWLGGNGGGKVGRLLARTRRFLVPAPERRTPSWLVVHALTRGVVLALVPAVIATGLLVAFLTSVYLAEIEYRIITPAPLVPSLDVYQFLALTIVMIGFVGFVEELLFRGILQKVLQAQLGTLPGLLLASGIFGLMHSVYGLPMEMLFAGVIGLVFGIVYDLTDSLVLVSVMHGMVNVFLFGVIPLDGASSLDLLRATAVAWLERVGADWAIELLPAFAGRLIGTVV
jgi:membrane protease YdiL (CAAX protease family)